MASISEQLAAVAVEIENAKSRGDNTALQSLYSQQLQLGFLAANADTAPVSAVVEVQSEPIVTVDLTDTVKSPENTNTDLTAVDTAEKYQNSEIVGDPTVDDPTIQRFDDGSFIQTFDDGSTLVGDSEGGVRGVPAGAEPEKPKSAAVNIRDAAGAIKKEDLRVKIRVPADYLTRLVRGIDVPAKDEIFKLGGVIFPYTPAISYEHKADYATQTPVHSNFTQYFYKNSSVSPISISGKFTVQNENDAGIYLGTVHLLKALTRMRYGGPQTGDKDSGAPTPVCRLDAYGDFMLKNVPVVISSFKIELPDSVDYFTLGKTKGNIYGQASVPISSIISLVCNPVYSRDEMQKFSVTGWLSDAKLRKAGYL
jgi:hypothetical protein